MPKHPSHGKMSLFSLWLITFIDLLGVGIIIPVLPVIFFASDLLPADTSAGIRTFLAAMLIAAYPIAQFFGATMLGALSDSKGRKPVLVISLIGTFAGYALFALGIAAMNLPLLFISRIIDGFTGGNLSVVRSAIADISSKKDKLKNFGLIGMAFGAGFIFGPFIGGKLTDSKFVSWFNVSTPFWFAALLVLANIALVIFSFHETLAIKRKVTLNFFAGISHIKKSIAAKHLRVVFLSMFLLNFGWSFFTQFFQLFLFQKFSFTPASIGMFFAYVGIWIVIAQGAVVRVAAKRFSASKILSYSILIVSILLAVLILPSKAWYLYFIMPFVAIAIGLTQPSFSTLLSNLSGKDSQGEVMGIQQSILSLAIAIPALVEGFLALALSSSEKFGLASIHAQAQMPLLLGSIFSFAAWLVFVMFFKEKSAQKNNS